MGRVRALRFGSTSGKRCSFFCLFFSSFSRECARENFEVFEIFGRKKEEEEPHFFSLPPNQKNKKTSSPGSPAAAATAASRSSRSSPTGPFRGASGGWSRSKKGPRFPPPLPLPAAAAAAEEGPPPRRPFRLGRSRSPGSAPPSAEERGAASWTAMARATTRGRGGDCGRGSRGRRGRLLLLLRRRRRRCRLPSLRPLEEGKKEESQKCKTTKLNHFVLARFSL